MSLMRELCNETHPDDLAIRCDEQLGSNHELHSGLNLDDLGAPYRSWPNTACKPPVRKADAATGKTLSALAREIADARKRV